MRARAPAPQPTEESHGQGSNANPQGKEEAESRVEQGQEEGEGAAAVHDRRPAAAPQPEPVREEVVGWVEPRRGETHQCRNPEAMSFRPHGRASTHPIICEEPIMLTLYYAPGA